VTTGENQVCVDNAFCLQDHPSAPGICLCNTVLGYSVTSDMLCASEIKLNELGETAEDLSDVEENGGTNSTSFGSDFFDRP